MISDIVFGVIKTLIESGRYRMVYDEDDNEHAGWKTRDYIRQLGMTEDVVVKEVTKTLNGSKCYSVDSDDNPVYAITKPGNIYKFKTQYHGDKLYVKYKLLEDPNYLILVFSIHPTEH